MTSYVHYFSNNFYIEIYDKDIILFDNFMKNIYYYKLNYKNVIYAKFNSTKNYKKFLMDEIKKDNVSVIYNEDYNTYMLELQISISEYAQPEYIKLNFKKINFNIYSKLNVYYYKKHLLSEELNKIKKDLENYKDTLLLDEDDNDETVSNDSFS